MRNVYVVRSPDCQDLELTEELLTTIGLTAGLTSQGPVQVLIWIDRKLTQNQSLEEVLWLENYLGGWQRSIRNIFIAKYSGGILYPSRP